MQDIGGWLWLVMDVIAVAVLGAGLAYGVMAWHYRRKDAQMERIRDEATHRVYEDRETQSLRR